MARLSREFYMQDTLNAAKSLLGCYLVRMRNGEALVGRIVETEAYIGRCDKACHAYPNRKTPRTAPLFEEPGHAYIYLIYGMHHCLNLVTEPVDEPSAVLIRALEPVSGVETMWRLRYGDAPKTAYREKNFMNGPGKLCKALSLSRDENRMDLTQNTLFVCETPEDIGLAPFPTSRERCCTGPRIGVEYAEEARDFPWRFWLEKEDSCVFL